MYIRVHILHTGFSCGTHHVECVCAGDLGSPRTTGWVTLPPEMEELIVSKLSVRELARVSSMCRLFKDVSCRHMVEFQKERCALAHERFGQERVSSIAALIDRLVRGEIGDPHLSKLSVHTCWILANGAMHVDEPSTPSKGDKRVGDICLSIFLTDFCIMVTAFAPKWASEVSFIGWPRENVARLDVFRCGGEDLEGVALAQALVSGALGQSFHTYGLPFDVHVWRCAGMGCSSAELQALLQAGASVTTHV
jgi:hypothetical protein